MTREKVSAILKKIKEYDRIIIFRHFRPDGDAVGSTKGLQAILRLTYPEKEIYLQNNDFSDYLRFLGTEDEPIADELYTDALALVLDTGTSNRISNPKYALCKEIIKIDHHIPIEDYGNFQWVEEERSSTCEMIAAFYDCLNCELKINTEAATYIYAGMVTDSGRFRFRDVSGETMRLAGIMLNQGIDTDTLFANLYLKDFDMFKFESFVYQKMKITENGVAYFNVTKAIQEKFGLTKESASSCVSYMDSIRGSLIWIAFIENDDGSYRVRLRSRFLPVNEIAERYHGGGHACACGATVYSKKELRALLAEADKLLGEYKATNEGWL
jgi:phosphoesterase RecJ-like protein